LPIVVVGLLLIGAAPAAAGGPVQGLEQICVSQHGTFIPDSASPVPGASVPQCFLEAANVTYSILEPAISEWARVKLVAADRLCQAADFAGVVWLVRPVVPDLTQVAVISWWCAPEANGIHP
jgi:hypothetical protein